MIKIVGARHYKDPNGKQQGKDEYFGSFPSVVDLLANLPRYLSKIPEAERYNLFFTQCDVEGDKRKFKEQWVIWFDMDLGPVFDRERLPEYIKIFCETLGLGAEKTGVIFSGHGLHFIIALNEPFKDPGFFKEYELHYKAVCGKVEKAVRAAGLPLKEMDPQVFSTGARGVRLPGTLNNKPGKASVLVELLHGRLSPVEFDLVKLSGLTFVAKSDQIKLTRKFKVDTEAVLTGCEFLKHCKTNPAKIPYATWFASLSVLGRLENGEKLAHEYSSGHPGYSPEETEQKLATALLHSGPRTCDNINTLQGWEGKCKTCPHFGKVLSPVSIKGEDFIETEESGFHTISYDHQGNPKGNGKPCYEDLRRFFDKKHQYRVMGASGICYVWTGTHYEMMEDPYIREYAQTHFKPTGTRTMRDEFRDIVCSTHLTPPNWFQVTTEKKINFKNGVLDLRTGVLSPHSREIGFRYCLPYDFDPGARAPVFEQFLKDITCGDQSLSDVLMEFAGHAFSGDFPKQGKTLVLSGKGSNGKSTLIDVLKELAGSDNYSALDWKLMKNETFREQMDGKLFNVAEESPDDALKDTSFFKCVTTGGEILINRKYKQPYKIRNKTKLIWACNELPKSKDTTMGFLRRFLIIPFNATFSDDTGTDDKDMREKLFTELPGIFNLVYQGYERLNHQGKFTRADASRRALDTYRDEIDHAATWIKTNVTWTPLNGGEKCAVVPTMYQQYRNELMSHGEDPITNIHFGKKLKSIIPDYDKRSGVKKIAGKCQRVLLDCDYLGDPKP